MNKEDIIDLLSDCSYGLLATTEGNQPRVRPMSPHLNDDGKLLVSLFPQLRTIDQIKANPLVEFCFVDRKMCFCRISGKAEMSNNMENKQLLWDRIPSLKQYFGGPDDPNFLLMEIDISHVEAMTPSDRAPVMIDF